MPYGQVDKLTKLCRKIPRTVTLAAAIESSPSCRRFATKTRCCARLRYRAALEA